MGVVIFLTVHWLVGIPVAQSEPRLPPRHVLQPSCQALSLATERWWGGWGGSPFHQDPVALKGSEGAILAVHRKELPHPIIQLAPHWHHLLRECSPPRTLPLHHTKFQKIITVLFQFFFFRSRNSLPPPPPISPIPLCSSHLRIYSIPPSHHRYLHHSLSISYGHTAQRFPRFRNV